MPSTQALIQPHPPAGEEHKVNGLLDAMAEQLGFVPDGLRLYSFSPPLLETFIGNIRYFNGGDRLDPRLMAMIRYLVSCAADCSYCIDLNETLLAGMGVDLAAVRAARDDLDAAPLPVREVLLLRFALRALREPETITASDISTLHDEGWSDRDLFDAVVQGANTSAFNQVLRAFRIEHQGALAG